MHLITNFGDFIVLLPAAICLAAFLYLYGARSDAVSYSLALFACLTAALFAKLAFAACSDGYASGAIESPSGHAAFSAAFYGCLAIVLATGRSIDRRLALYLAAAALTAMIGISRVAIQAHTGPEVLVGLAIGAASIALFCFLRVRPERLDLTSRQMVRLSPLALFYAFGVVALAGHWSPEPVIHHFAKFIGVDFHICR
jgi:membrane-associated phospholipid phosphatase